MKEWGKEKCHVLFEWPLTNKFGQYRAFRDMELLNLQYSNFRIDSVRLVEQWFSTRGTRIIWVLRAAFATISLDQKNTYTYSKRRKGAQNTLAQAACEIALKLTAGVNFINILCAVFTLADPKSTKRHCCLITFLLRIRDLRL